MSINPKYCPLKFAVAIAPSIAKLYPSACLCEHEKCAWWNQKQATCIIFLYGCHTQKISEALQMLSDTVDEFENASRPERSTTHADTSR